MPIPIRSNSLRQPGFSKAQPGDLNSATPNRARTSSDARAETLGPKYGSQQELDGDHGSAGSHVQGGIMGPPRHLTRASSVQQSSRPGLEASTGTTHPLRNASRANQPGLHGGTGLRRQPVSFGANAGTQRPQSTENLDVAQIPAVESLTKPRTSLHSRSQSARGPITMQAHPQEYIGPRRKESSASSQRLLPPQSLPTAGQGQTLSRMSQIPAGKPQFSTYQQHFSPKKPLKAPVPPTPGHSSNPQHPSSKVSEDISSDGRPAADTTPSPPAQTLQLQDELLQLQILHRSASSQQKIYLKNTMQKFKKQFAALSRDDRAVAAQELAYSTKMNRLALQQWLSEGDQPCSGKIQTLSQCVQDIATLTAPEGKLCTATGQFETWFENVLLISNSRSSATTLPEHHDALVSPLDQEWHDLVAVLQRKLDHCSRVLHDLGSAREGSGVAMVLEAHKLFVDNLRQELEYYCAIERSTLQQEQQWIAEAIVRIVEEDDPRALDSQNDDLGRGAWNVDTV